MKDGRPTMVDVLHAAQRHYGVGPQGAGLLLQLGLSRLGQGSYDAALARRRGDYKPIAWHDEPAPKPEPTEGEDGVVGAYSRALAARRAKAGAR